MAVNGGKRPGSGRKKGKVDNVTAEVRAYAGGFCKEAIDKLYHLMTTASTDAVQLQAARELLDRGIGKPVQPVSNDIDENGKAISLQVTFVSP